MHVSALINELINTDIEMHLWCSLKIDFTSRSGIYAVHLHMFYRFRDPTLLWKRKTAINWTEIGRKAFGDECETQSRIRVARRPSISAFLSLDITHKKLSNDPLKHKRLLWRLSSRGFPIRPLIETENRTRQKASSTSSNPESGGRKTRACSIHKNLFQCQSRSWRRFLRVWRKRRTRWDGLSLFYVIAGREWLSRVNNFQFKYFSSLLGKVMPSDASAGILLWEFTANLVKLCLLTVFVQKISFKRSNTCKNECPSKFSKLVQDGFNLQSYIGNETRYRFIKIVQKQFSCCGDELPKERWCHDGCLVADRWSIKRKLLTCNGRANWLEQSLKSFAL